MSWKVYHTMKYGAKPVFALGGAGKHRWCLIPYLMNLDELLHCTSLADGGNTGY